MTKSDLQQFTGTENYYRHILGGKFTDGVKYLADKAGAYWLIDVVFSYQKRSIREKYPFQTWKLIEHGNGVLVMGEDGNDFRFVHQKIGYSDFPRELLPIELFLTNGVLMLPSEY